MLVVLGLSQGFGADTLYFPTTATNEYANQWYSGVLKSLGEPRLNSRPTSATHEIYRLTIIPTWGNSISIRLTKSNSVYTVASRRLDGEGGTGNPGKLAESRDSMLTDKDSRVFEQLFSAMDIFKMPAVEDYEMNDGDRWILEAFIVGRYHFIDRCCISAGDPKKRGTVPFITLCKFLVERSQLSDPPRELWYELLPR